MHSLTGVLRGRSLSCNPPLGRDLFILGCCHVQLYIKSVANKASKKKQTSEAPAFSHKVQLQKKTLSDGLRNE